MFEEYYGDRESYEQAGGSFNPAGGFNVHGELNGSFLRNSREEPEQESSSFGSQSARFREEGKEILRSIEEAADPATYKNLSWQGSFSDYLGIVAENPQVTENAWQRLSAMIESYGVSTGENGLPHYHIFDDPFNGGKDAVYGMDRQLAELVNIFKAGAGGLGPQNRIILLHGPVGTAKSTIARLLKQGLEEYSKTEEGALFTLGFELYPGHPEYDPRKPHQVKWCPMNEEPLHLVPDEHRELIVQKLNENIPDGEHKTTIEQHLCPCCREEYRELLEKHGGDWNEVLKYVRIRRVVLSETDRVGIGSFQPKDEKNQDSTELTGDINYRKIAVYGSDSDPRAFNFDGEFNISNRGLLEFIEVLKLNTAFLYDLLGATQEHVIKPKKFAQTEIDEVIIAHTNEPEFLKLVSDKTMEAFRDRTIKIDIPYNLAVSDEMRIYEKTFGSRGEEIAPHTIEVAAMWAVLSRLEQPNNANLTLLNKMKLYNGQPVPGFTPADVRELKEEAKREGMHGISPRYIQDTMSLALTVHGRLTPLIVLDELQAGLDNNALIDDEKERKRYAGLIAHVRREYEEIVKREVQKAAACDQADLEALCANYLGNVKAYVENLERERGQKKRRVNEKLMRSIEERLGISETRKHDFRRELVHHMRALEEKGKRFEYTTNERLHSALIQKLFEDQKDLIKLTFSDTEKLTPRLQKRIEKIKENLMTGLGYTEQSAEEVLRLATDIFSR